MTAVPPPSKHLVKFVSSPDAVNEEGDGNGMGEPRGEVLGVVVDMTCAVLTLICIDFVTVNISFNSLIISREAAQIHEQGDK